VSFKIEQQGRVIRLINPALKPVNPPPPSKRGNVNQFSVKSRRRLIDLTMRLDVEQCRTVFITLTFAGMPTPQETKRAFRMFTMRMRRWFPEMSAFWRIEQQKRGSNHYHLVMFNVPFFPWWWLKDVWTECTGEVTSRVDIRLVKGPRRLMSYVSKYVAKLPEAEEPFLVSEPYQHKPSLQPFQGRFWGTINTPALPMAARQEAEIFDPDVAGYLQFAIRSLSAGKSGRFPYSQKLYSDDAETIMEYALKVDREATGHDAGALYYPPTVLYSLDRNGELLERANAP